MRWFVVRVVAAAVVLVVGVGVGVRVWVGSQSVTVDDVAGAPAAVPAVPAVSPPANEAATDGDERDGKGKAGKAGRENGGKTPGKGGSSGPDVPEPDAGPLYVALGDSFSSGFGVQPADPASGACARSTVNYPALVAQATGAVLTDLSCSGATTDDLLASQLGSLNGSTDLVTLTIGGNNSALFSGTLQACGAAGLQARGQGSPCKDAFGSQFEDTVASSLAPGVRTVLDTIVGRAPNAQVVIVGYPWILPSKDGCFNVLPVAEGDVPYVRGIQAAANEAVKDAATAAGVTFVDMSGLSDGRDLCAQADQQWMDPATVHPNAAGQAAMAEAVLKVVTVGG